MNITKKYLVPFICISILLTVGFNLNKITNSLANFLDSTPRIVIDRGNEYTKDHDFLFVKTSEDYIPYRYNDLIDIIYSALNNGWETFTFYCPKEYIDCLSDLRIITSDSILLTHINNYVHPYNSINGLDIITNETGEVTLKPKFVYTNKQINKINTEIDSILTKIIEVDMEIEDKIMVIHDFIVNNVKYDIERNEKGTSPYKSNIAYGPLFEGYATCDGYADIMAIFLNKLELKNYRIATIKDTDIAGHVWNAVLLNNSWLHLDLTWNDPISSSGEDILRHKYFLITDEELIIADSGEVEVTEHEYDISYYLEFKKAVN